MADDNETRYRKMLLNVSTELQRRDVSLDMLKCALFELVKARGRLDDAKTPFDLFMLLDDACHISKNDISLLNALFELLGFAALKDIISDHGFRDSDVNPSHVFSSLCISIVDIGHRLTNKNIQQIASVYKVNKENRSNQWKMLQYLQYNNRLNKKEDVMEICKIIEQNKDDLQWNPAGIPQKDFQEMLIQVSKWYDDNCVDIMDTLIVLYKDIVTPVTDLEAAENVMDLFELLKCAGHLTTTNYDILIDTANLTGTQGVLSCNKILSNAQKTNSKTVFSSYRQKLVKFGNKLLTDDIKVLASLTNVPRREQQNQWTMILNLERRDIISEDNMESFITMLKENGLSRLAKELEGDLRWNPAEEDIPLEVWAHGPEAQNIFTDAQKNGVVEVTQGRVIFMGLERVGKTSTIKKFLKEKFNPNEEPTDALATNRTCIQESDNWNEVGDDKSPVVVIHEKKKENADAVEDSALTKGKEEPKPAGTSTATNVAPEIVEEIVKKMRFTSEATSEWKESTDEFIMNIWDFGGQPIYHVIQRVYIPSFAVVCVVFNLEHDLNSHAIVMDHTNGESYEHRMTYLDFILFWIRTACTNRIAGKEPDQSVLLIGTHCNSLKLGKNEKERKSQIDRKLNKILKSLKDKPYEEMVLRKIFTIENSVAFNESNSSEIMKQILTFTKKKVQKLPFNWLYVQNEIQKLKKEHICQETSKIIDLLERCQIPQREQKVLLQYLHDTGEIFYYPDDEDLRNYIVVDLIHIVVLSRAIITIKNPELQESMVQAWRNLDNGILERRLLIHLWSKLGVENEKVDFFASLLEYFGLMCKGKDQESGFYVLSRLKPERKNIPDKDYGNRAISIFHDFSNYLPDSFFQCGATKFITRFQMKYKKPTLSYERVELNIDEKHLVILNVETINHRRMFKTTIIRSKLKDGPDEEPEASMCKKVLKFLNVEFSKEQCLEMMMCIPGECCENHQLLPVESFDTCQISCGDKATDITRYNRLFGNCALMPLRHNDLSKRNFNDLLYDVASTWKDKGDVNRLKVILCEFKFLAIKSIENNNEPYDLLQLLIGPGIISQSDVKVLIEAAELGDVQSVESKIKKKVPSFAGFNKHVIHKFSAHRQNLINFGKKLGCEAVTKIAQLYEIDKPADEWMLIFKLERKGELTEKTKEKFIERLTEKGMGVEANELNMF